MRQDELGKAEHVAEVAACGLVQEAAELVSLCRSKIREAEVQVKTIAEKLEIDAPDTADDEDEDE